jgi:purine-nucleoside phosphorylase
MTDGVFAIESASQFLRSRSPLVPRVGLVLGSGLGGIVRSMNEVTRIDFAEIPHFVPATAIGHRGRVHLGTWRDTPVMALQGRLHGYEGHSPADVAFPLRVMAVMGVTTLILTNAAGGLNPLYRVGELVLLADQINLSFRNPLVGANDPALGPRWPDMSQPFDAELLELATTIGRRESITCHHGVYVGMLGPTYETRAEYRLLRRIGGDVVGMSTVGEVIVARQLGLNVLGISVVSNQCAPDRLTVTSGEGVVAAVAKASSQVESLISSLLASLPRERA